MNTVTLRECNSEVSPLGAFLRRDGSPNQSRFGEIYGDARSGKPVSQARVSRWCRGEELPNPSSRFFIEKATRGQVPVAIWGRWEAKFRDLGKRQKQAG